MLEPTIITVNGVPQMTKYPELKVLDYGYVRLIEAWGRGDADEPEAGIIEAARQSTQGSFRGWETEEKLLATLFNHSRIRMKQCQYDEKGNCSVHNRCFNPRYPGCAHWFDVITLASCDPTARDAILKQVTQAVINDFCHQ
jgi:hypothetical protein